ncbi:MULTISPECIES: ABC transporter permease [Streptomyces]|uniref:Transporter n=1 Tax=Streptomyces spororaveus TaxID=284039 RepID=A0ABQ3TP54_9ACTN|nr:MULTISPECIES: ABC transporter permease [Streptomyces]MCM9077476.1 ABC transporter permease [Streptomyces spororaveus]MCX5308049.1 ABC transporter permease [Streptomyces sp. NBC_00160]GHI82196.1 transporter [Streptomyces spororaveus]
MSGLALKGPYWVAARQHRRALWGVPAVVAAGLVAVVALRSWAEGPNSGGAGGPVPNDGYQMLRLCMEYAGTCLLFLPLLVGAFVAGPVTARELESGTWRLALTQSTTPKTWLGSKVAVAAAVSVLGGAALAGVYRLGWARVTGSYQLHWADRGVYEASGPVLVAYCLLGVALGVLVGQLVRRTLAAMALTGMLTGLVMLGLGALRWSLLPVETATMPVRGNLFEVLPSSALMTDTGLLTSTGERLPEYACFERTHHLSTCPSDMDVTGWYVEFHPASHYWPTQLLESSLVLALAGAALFFAFRLVGARRA